MNDITFFKNFKFNEYCFREMHHTDNSRGVDLHFIGFMKEGRGLLVSEKGRLELETNDMFYIPKGCKYKSYWTGDDTVRFDSIGFLYFPSNTPNGYALQKIEYGEELWQMFLPLSEDKTVNSASIGRLYTILGQLESTLVEEVATRAAATVEKAIMLMNKDPMRSMDEYAVECGVSEAQFYLCFKKVLQKTPNRVKQEIICEKAIHYLTTTDLTVEEVCDKTGFSSSSYFRKVFFSVTGKTPSQVRKESYPCM